MSEAIKTERGTIHFITNHKPRAVVSYFDLPEAEQKDFANSLTFSSSIDEIHSSIFARMIFLIVFVFISDCLLLFMLS